MLFLSSQMSSLDGSGLEHLADALLIRWGNLIHGSHAALARRRLLLEDVVPEGPAPAYLSVSRYREAFGCASVRLGFGHGLNLLLLWSP
jgi:hypothetical protein